MSEFEAGDSLPELHVTPDAGLTKRYAEASGDPNPIHIDEDFAKKVGLPGCILHGLYSMAQVAKAHTDAAGGDPRALKRLEVQFRGMGFPEQEIVVTSTVRGGGRTAASSPRPSPPRATTGSSATPAPSSSSSSPPSAAASQHLARVAVRWEHRIEDVLDPPESITSVSRLMSVSPATSKVGSPSAPASPSPASERIGNGRPSRSASSL